MFNIKYLSIELTKNVYRAAAEAAIARTQKKDPREFNTSLAAIRLQVQRELEAERKAAQQETEQAKPVSIEENKNLAVKGVFFKYAKLMHSNYFFFF